MDGSLIQVFREDGRVYFTTRGMIEGARWRWDEKDEDNIPEFDFLGEARRLMQERYPAVLDEPAVLEGRTLLFEFIHPGARKVTNYGDMADLVLIAGFDRTNLIYFGFEELARLAALHDLRLVDVLTPAGERLAEQIDALLAAMAGTDEEGSVVCFERGGEVIYRVKVKSPEYLQLMRLMAFCNYERTVALIDSNPEVQSWDDLKAVLQKQGNDRVPEEVLVFYREHWERFQVYLADLAKLRVWAEGVARHLDAEIGGRAGREQGEYRKAYAAKATTYPYSGLLFAALDGKLDIARLRKMIPSEKEATDALVRLELA